MRTAICLLVATALVGIGIAVAQTPARPQFQAASIKRNTGCDDSRDGGGPSPGRLSLPCVSLRDLILSAYGEFADGATLNTKVKKSDILGGPAWLDSESYEVNAKAGGNAPLGLMMGPMLQTLLEDRCKLKIHKESRESPVYALTVAKGGLKIHATTEGSCTPLDLNQMLSRSTPRQPQQIPCGFPSRRGTPFSTTVDSHGMTMAEFVERILERLDRPVIDRTGLTGMFDIHLEYVPDNASSGPVRLNGVDAPGVAASTSDTGGASVFTALQEQLGLKLSPDKGPVEVLIIDSVERPSEN